MMVKAFESPGSVSQQYAVRAHLFDPARRHTVGLLTHGAGDPNSEAVWAGVESVAREHDVNLICFPGKPLRSPHGHEAQSNVIFDLAGPENVDGLIIWSGVLSHRVGLAETIEFCRRYRPLPMVTIGHPMLEGIPGVVLDNYQGMHDVITHLVEYHNRAHIAFVRGPELQPEAQQRFQAYLDVLAEHDLAVDPELILQGDFKENGGAAAVERLLSERRLHFDALVAASDNMAIGAMKALQARGFHIPADIAVAGFNDEIQGRFITPPLTTVPFRSYEMARRAAGILLDLLSGQVVAEQTALPTRLIVRQSCGCSDRTASDAAGLDGNAQEGYPRATIAGRRSAILASMARGWERPLENPPTASIERLVDAFVREVSNGEAGSFLRTLAGILQASGGESESISEWQSAISELRREVVPCLRDRAALLRAENLWHQARVMLGEGGLRAEAWQALAARSETHLLGEMAQAMSNAVTEQDLQEALVPALRMLGIPRCHLFSYVHPDEVSREARVVMACEGEGQLDIDAAHERFPSRLLAPPGLLPVEQRHCLVVAPLYFRSEQLGFALMEAEPHMEETCDILREQIAGAMKRAQLYRQAAEAQRVAEEGRGLAEEANRLKSRFLATVSHELRTPLALIIGTVEVMLRQDAPGQAALDVSLRRDLAAIRMGAQHLAHLIGDVLDLTSSQAGELRLKRLPVSMSGVLTKAAVLGQHMAGEKGLVWKTDLPPCLPSVLGDETRLEQVVLNLISNAVKFTDEGSVTLRASVEGQTVAVTVTDTGLGIPPDEQEAIFDEFRQSDRTLARGCGGMGLGLAISKRLAELQGGTIAVSSSGVEGDGSSFRLTLPTLEAVLERRTALDLGQPGEILLLVSHPAAGDRVQQHLEAKGFRVAQVSAEGGPVDLAAIKAPPHAILVELDQASGRSWDLVHALQQDSATQNTPVLFYSLAEDGKTGSVLPLSYLTKPIDGSDLAYALDSLQTDTRESARPAILIVEDDPCLLDLHARLVEQHLPGCVIITARNGRQALERLAVARPNLVLLDLMMPEVDGFTVLEAMRGSEAWRDIPVVILTARTLTAADMARLQSGVAVILSKGVFTTAEVLAQIETALARSRHLGREAQRIVRGVMAFIHEHFADPITNRDLACHAGLSERHLARCFCEETGMTPLKYLTRYRVKQAKALLDQGSGSITEVAIAVGFSDSSYFGRVFREEVGLSPGAYVRRTFAGRQ